MAVSKNNQIVVGERGRIFMAFSTTNDNANRILNISKEQEYVNIYPNPTNTNSVTLRESEMIGKDVIVNIYNLQGSWCIHPNI